MYAYEELIEKARKNGDIYHFDGKNERGSAQDKKISFFILCMR